MLSRREMLASGFASTLADSSTAHDVEQASDRELRAVVSAIDKVGDVIESGHSALPMSGRFIDALRKNFDNFIRGNGKFPDFCDVGLACFYQVYDWHVRNRQQIVATRQADNRYTIQFMFTTLILRFENEPNFVGVPYDKA